MSQQKKSSGSGSHAAPTYLRIAPISGAPKKPSELPKVEAPSLQGLSVTVPAPTTGVTEQDIARRFHELRRELSPKKPRKFGDALAMGDEVRVDMLALMGGTVLPFSFRKDTTMELNELPHLPGLATAMAAGKMGDKLFVGLTLPSTYPAPALRGQKIEMLVDINAAAEVSLLAEDSPELLKHLNRGKTLEEVMVAIRQELIDEAGDQLVREGHLLVLAKLVERAGAIPVTADQIDAEIVADWKRLEGKKMEEKQLDRTTLESAKLGWLHDPSTRRDAELRIKVSLVIRAIAERDGIKVTPESLKEQLVRTVPGMDEAGANEALNETMETTAVLAEYGLYLATVEHVMKHAEIKFAGAKA